jgi:apoptotic chromatin condensation inducer in the nucleus
LGQTGSDAPKDVFQPALKRSFGRSDSMASVDSPKERIGQSLAPCGTDTVSSYFVSEYLLIYFSCVQCHRLRNLQQLL